MKRTKLARAAKEHRCWDCEALIRVGDRYLLSVLSPGHEFGHPTRWTNGRFCETCCCRYTYEAQLWAEAQAAA